MVRMNMAEKMFPQTLPSPSASSRRYSPGLLSGERKVCLDELAKSWIRPTPMEKGKEVEQGEMIPVAKVTDVTNPVAKVPEDNFPVTKVLEENFPVTKANMENLTVATPPRPTKLWLLCEKKTRQPKPLKKMKTPEMIISSVGSVVLELDEMANLSTEVRRQLIILLSSEQQQLYERYDVISHYHIGMECGHGKDCRDPEPPCFELTVPRNQVTPRTPPQPSNKLLKGLGH